MAHWMAWDSRLTSSGVIRRAAGEGKVLDMLPVSTPPSGQTEDSTIRGTARTVQSLLLVCFGSKHWLPLSHQNRWQPRLGHFKARKSRATRLSRLAT